MKNYTLKLKGYVGGWNFDKDYVDYILERNKDKHVDVLIDSLGGSVADALSIAASFRNHGDVSVHFVGMNASAATIASMGAKSISIDAHALYLVHKCSQTVLEWANMNADQLAQHIQELQHAQADLEKIDDVIASMYAGRCKKDTSAMLDLMKEGAWLTAKEAKDWGFVDEITEEQEDKAPELNAEIKAFMEYSQIPVPNIPESEDKPSFFDKLVAMLGKHFQPLATAENDTEGNEQPQNIIDMKKFPLFAALFAEVLAISAEGTCALNEEQLGTLEAALQANQDAVAAKDKEIADLQAKVKEHQATIDEQNAKLDKQPGDTTTQVQASGSADEGEFFAVAKAAQELDALITA